MPALVQADQANTKQFFTHGLTLDFVVTCSYQTSNVGFDSRDDRYGLFVTFDREVEETRSHLSIGKLLINHDYLMIII